MDHSYLLSQLEFTKHENASKTSLKNPRLNFNHPITEVYPGITPDEIKYIYQKICEETEYKSGSFPIEVFNKYYIKHLVNKNKTNYK